MAKIFVSWPGYSASDPDTGARLVAAGHELVLHPKLGTRSADELMDLMAGCAAAIVSTDPFTGAAIASNVSVTTADGTVFNVQLLLSDGLLQVYQNFTIRVRAADSRPLFAANKVPPIFVG